MNNHAIASNGRTPGRPGTLNEMERTGRRIDVHLGKCLPPYELLQPAGRAALIPQVRIWLLPGE
jgi:hypothetical protein